MSNQPVQKGELEVIRFGDKVLTVKRKCSCGGDVHIDKIPNTQAGYIATCQKCGVSLQWGDKPQEK